MLMFRHTAALHLSTLQSILGLASRKSFSTKCMVTPQVRRLQSQQLV
jgi:hypothetical protein